MTISSTTATAPLTVWLSHDLDPDPSHTMGVQEKKKGGKIKLYLGLPT